MEKDSSKNGRIDVRLINGRYILSELVGFIDAETTERAMQETERLSTQLRQNGKPVYLMIDGAAVTGQDSGARRATKALGSMGIKKIAICGGNVTTALVAQYLVRAIKVTDRAKAFRNRKKGEHWLLHESRPADREAVRMKVGATVVAVMAGVSLFGWMVNDKVLTEFLPNILVMNPVVAVTFLLLSVTTPLVAYLLKPQKKKKASRRVVGCIVAVVLSWTVLLSASVWLRVVWGADVQLDRWLFADRVGVDAFAAIRTVFNFMLVVVMLLAVLTGQKNMWERLVFYIAWWVIGINTILIALGYAYGYSLADITSYAPMPLTTALCFMALIYSMRSLTRPMSFFVKVQTLMDKYKIVITVCVIGMVLSGVLWQQSKLDLSRNVGNKVSAAYSKTRSILTERIANYNSLLYSTRSLFEASDNVSPDEFTVYFSSSEIEKYLPGLNGMAYVAKVAASDKAPYQNEIRGEASKLNPQLSKFTLHPASTQPESYVITYVEPDKTNVKDSLGYDLSTNGERLKVLQTARDTGEVTTTATININTAVQGVAPDRPGFFMTAPIYTGERQYGEPQSVQDRRDRLVGFINASFVYSELFDDVFSSETAKDVRYVISDAETKTVLHTYNPDASSIEPEVRYEGDIDFGGRLWKLTMYTSNTFGSTVPERTLPPVILVGGLAISALLTLIAVSGGRRREHAIAMAEIMTEDLNNERNLAVAARNKNDAILASIGDAVFVVDDKERITLFNRTAEAISGYSAKEALGRPYKEILSFISEDSGNRISTFIQKALNGHLAHMHNHTYLLCKDGKKVAVADSAAPLLDNADGKVLGAIIVFRDVTREAELSNAKDEFVSLASHQLRTPLSAVKWYSEMLLGGDAGKLNKTQAEYIRQMYDGNERMIELVNSLLSVSRIDLGKFVNDPEDVSVPKLVSSLKSEMSEQIQSKKIKLNIDISRNLQDIYVDPKLIRAIIQNLLSNSIKYTNDGGTITVIARSAHEGECKKVGVRACDRYILLSVADNGRGIPKSQQGRVFEKMFRADNAVVMNVEGTGLGLYIIRQIIEKLGGKIWFESEENVGTTFNVMLPVRTQKVVLVQTKTTAKEADKTDGRK